MLVTFIREHQTQKGQKSTTQLPRKAAYARPPDNIACPGPLLAHHKLFAPNLETLNPKPQTLNQKPNLGAHSCDDLCHHAQVVDGKIPWVRLLEFLVIGFGVEFGGLLSENLIPWQMGRVSRMMVPADKL